MTPFNDISEKAYITKEALGPIAENYSISDLDNFYFRMNGIAEIYFHTKENFEDRPTIKKTKKSLEKIHKLAEKLADTIDKLNDFEKIWLWMAQRHVRSFFDPKYFKLKPHEKVRIEVHGNPVHLQGLEESGYDRTYMETDELRDALSAFQGFAQYGLDHMPKGRDGRKKQHGLFMLISNLEIYWTKDLGRKFTFDEYKGEGITEAFDFCCDIMKVLDPKVTYTQIQSQMRHVIAKK